MPASRGNSSKTKPVSRDNRMKPLKSIACIVFAGLWLGGILAATAGGRRNAAGPQGFRRGAGLPHHGRRLDHALAGHQPAALRRGLPRRFHERRRLGGARADGVDRPAPRGRPGAAAAVAQDALRRRIQGPSMCELFNVSGGYFEYAITYSCVYLYSPAEHPGAIFAGSSDDGMKVILNGRESGPTRSRRSPTYDGDQAPAPLKKGWNVLVVAVDQIIGGHLLCAASWTAGRRLPTWKSRSIRPPPRPGGFRPAPTTRKRPRSCAAPMHAAGRQTSGGAGRLRAGRCQISLANVDSPRRLCQGRHPVQCRGRKVVE